jgi:threonine dehydratase
MRPSSTTSSTRRSWRTLTAELGEKTAAVVGPDEVEAAASRIAGHVRTTPVLELEAGALDLDFPIALKLELTQRTGSFKLRGAFSAILASDVPEAGVVAASGGNFALAVARAAADLGHPATIFVPENSPPAKVDRLRRSPAEVVVAGAVYDDALAALHEHAEGSGALELHAFDHPLIVAGQGTCSMEFDRQAQGLDTVLVGVGGGGLCAGAAAWFGDRVKVVAVEPEKSQAYRQALEAGEPITVEVGGIAADSLGAKRVGATPWTTMRVHGVESVLVSDEAIRSTQQRLWLQARIGAEPGGSAALAALVSGAYEPEPGERVGVIMSGANFDQSVLT